MNIEFSGKKVLVTGGTRGIGTAIANGFAKAGAHVYCLGKNEANFTKMNKASDQMEFLQCDLSDKTQRHELIESLKNLDIDILINNAGINKTDFIDDINNEDFAKVQQINVEAPFLLSQASLPNMKNKKWGRIVNIGSIFGSITKAKRTSYTTSKAALIGMTKTMAVECASDNVLVNCVSPGFIDTELTRANLTPDEIKGLEHTVPIQRLGQAEEIASVVCYLASEANTFLTGQNITVDGGVSLV